MMLAPLDRQTPSAPSLPGRDGGGEFILMRGQKRVEDARRRAGVPRIHVFGKKARRGSPGQAALVPAIHALRWH